MDKNKEILRETIDKMVRKSLTESLRKEHKFKSLVNRIVSEQIQKINEEEGEKNNKKRSVIQWLQKPEVNTAEIRRRVEGEPESQEEEDAKRSYFMKKVNQSNDKDFSDEEVNKLYAVKSELGQ